MEYAAVVEAGLPQTTVEALAAQGKATVEILPADADGDPENGHQAVLIDGQDITISVTSADGIRMLVYRVGISHCLSGLSETRLNSVQFVGGSVGALARLRPEPRRRCAVSLPRRRLGGLLPRGAGVSQSCLPQQVRRGRAGRRSTDSEARAHPGSPAPAAPSVN